MGVSLAGQGNIGSSLHPILIDTSSSSTGVVYALAHDDVLNASHLKLIGCCRGDPINIGILHSLSASLPCHRVSSPGPHYWHWSFALRATPPTERFRR
jgi:hypothetical protein